jgi:hypothetical protein
MDMPSVHRSDIDCWLSEFACQNKSFNSESPMISPIHLVAPEMFMPFLLPYINVEDLSQDKMLLFLLHSRAYVHPQEFTTTDIDACLFARSVGVIPIPDLDDYRMIFRKTDNFNEYVQLIEIKESFTANKSLKINAVFAHTSDSLL